MEKVDSVEVLKLLNSIDLHKKQSGEIPNSILKTFSAQIVQPFTDIINECIENGIFPNELKIAEVVPILKRGNSMDKENYRPISLLPTLSKIFEKIIHKQLGEYFDKILSPLLCGFRKGLSTQFALLRFMKKCQGYLDKSQHVGMILMDLSKAYDCIPHDLLIAKLEAYGVKGNALKLLFFLLNELKQRVRINSTFSNFLKIIKGVPQGSVLGPLLFNIFLNDLLLTYNLTEICNFADDNSIFTSGNSISNINLRLVKGLDIIMEWYKINSMIANPKKFQYIIFNRCNHNTKSHVRLGDIELSSQEYVKLLGINFDTKLNFKIHIDSLCKEAQKRLLALLRIRKYLSKFQAHTLARSFILSQFKYCNLIWIFCRKSENSRIDKIHERTLRCVYGGAKNENFKQLLSKNQECSIHVQNLQSLMLLIHKVTTGMCPQIAADFFSLKTVRYNLRSSHLVNLPDIKTTKYGTNTVFFKGALIWNALPNEIKNLENTNSFKKKIKRWKPKMCTCNICI